MQNNTLINKYVNKFNSSGFIVIRKLLNSGELRKYENEVNRVSKILIKRYKPPYVNLTSDGKVNTAHNLDKIFPKSLLLNIKNNKILKKFLIKLFKEKAVTRNLEIFAKPSKTGMEAPFHQDNYYWNITDKRAVNIWISLDKVNKKNGGLVYLEKSHHKLLNHTSSKIKGTSQEISQQIINKLNYKKISPSLMPGDCIIHHCEIIHGSNKNLSFKNRRAVVVSFKANSSSINQIKMKKYLNKLKKKLK